LNEPGGQSLQNVDPEEFEYCPGGQFKHVEFEVAPIAVEKVPGGQRLHVCAELDDFE
jgi:hypothetical protein